MTGRRTRKRGKKYHWMIGPRGSFFIKICWHIRLIRAIGTVVRFLNHDLRLLFVKNACVRLDWLIVRAS